MRKKVKAESAAPNPQQLTNEQLLQVVARLSRLVQQQNGRHVPVSIFASSLSPAESLVKYLKEQEKLRYADIARMLNRDQRGIWCTYRRAQQKNSGALKVTPSEHTVPVALFTDRTFSILEHVVSHLRAQNIPVKTIAELVQKSPSTIATVHHRARRKLE